mgnify:FL=1
MMKKMYNKGGRLEKRAAKLKTKSDKLKSKIGTVKRKVNVGLPDSMGMQGVTEKTVSNPTDKQKQKLNRLSKRSEKVAGYMKAQAGPGNALAGKGAKLGKMAMGMGEARGKAKAVGQTLPPMGRLPRMEASQIIEPATPRMFEDGGLKRKDRQDKRVSNRLAKKTASGKKLGKKESALKSKRDLAAAKSAADAARKNIKKVTPKRNVLLPVDRRAGTLPGGTSGGSVLKKATDKVNAQQKNLAARQRGESSMEKDTLARKNKTGQYQTFGSAFSQARAKAKKAGNADGGIFTYKGKKYNTKTKKATPKKKEPLSE